MSVLTQPPVWEERCIEGHACDWWLRGHEDKAHAIVADGTEEVDQTGMVTNYPSYVVGIVVRLFNDTVSEDAILVLEGFCPWHNDRLDQGRCILSGAGVVSPRTPSLSWSAGTDSIGTWIVGCWSDGVDRVSRRWVFHAAEIQAATVA